MSRQAPNLVFIFTDQQHAGMMSCVGNRDLKTPAMDRLAAEGVRFTRAYCTNPVCLPSRFSLMTGRMPGEVGIRRNEDGGPDFAGVPEDITRAGLGWLLRNVGYETAYGGKVHLPKLSPEELGFDVISTDHREGLASDCESFLSRPHDRPFLLVASFVNPHDICYMAIRDSQQDESEVRLTRCGVRELAEVDRALTKPDGMDDETYFTAYCPALPDNFQPQEDEPEMISRILDQRPFKRYARDQWSERRWQQHRLVYAKLTERVDGHIQRVLDAIDANGLRDNTVVIFSSDHGDMDGAHRMDHKSVLYDEACHIPLIVRDPVAGRRGEVNDRSLISNGLDLLPTLCDYAGASVPEDLQGLSFRPLVAGQGPTAERAFIPIDDEFGRAIVTSRFMYVLYHDGASREQLYDLQRDPGQTRNFAHDDDCQEALEDCRRMYADAFGE